MALCAAASGGGSPAASAVLLSCAEANAHAEASSRLLTEELGHFDQAVEYICHEMRNPLHVVSGVLQTFDSEQLLDPAAVATEVSLMRQCVSEMIDVSNDLLDVSALRRGMLRVNVVPTALHDFLRALKQDPRCGDVIIAADDDVPAVVSIRCA